MNTQELDPLADHRKGIEALQAKAAHADKLAEALRGLIAEVKLDKLNIRKDFSLINHHAYASKCLHQYESEAAQ